MKQWYTVKVKYTKQEDDGKIKNITEPYLISAVSFTDAEAIIHEEVGQVVRGDFSVKSMTITDYHDVFRYDDSEVWNKCQVTFEDQDLDSEKTVKTKQNFLVAANNVKEAYDRIDERLKNSMATYETPSISKTTIVDVISSPDKETVDNG